MQQYNFDEVPSEPQLLSLASRYRCGCDKTVSETDDGYFVEDGIRHDDIPVRTIGLEDTGSSHEYIDYWVGPLRCYEGMLDKDDGFRNAMYSWSKAEFINVVRNMFSSCKQYLI